MKKLFKFKKEFILLLIIIVLASFLRLWQLGSVPVGMTDDEIRESYTAYSIAHTGKDIYGNFLPVVFKIDGYNTWGQTPIYFSSIVFLFTSLTPFAARFPYALFSIFSVVLFYLIVKKLLNSQPIAILSSFAISVSVWNLQIARLASDISTSLLMYMISILFFLQVKKRTGFLIASMLFFFLAFYSYGATKVIFLPLVFVLTWYKFKDLTRKHLAIIVLGVTFAFGTYGFLGITQGALSYSGNPFFFQDKEKTALSVELERRASNEPQIIETLYHNKFTYWFRVAATNYLTAFSPQYLFLDQESSGIFSIWGRGELYIFELPLIVMGIAYLLLKKRKEFYLVLMLLLISPLPSAVGVGGGTWTSRSAFMVFWLYTFVGAGIYYLLTLFKKQNYKYLIFTVIILMYIYSVSGYLFQYYYDWSRINSKYFATTTKDLAYTTNKYTKEGRKVIISGVRPVEFLHFAFYNKIDPKIVQSKINQFPIELDNVTFTQGCFINPDENPYKFISSGIVYISNVLCNYKVKPVLQITTYKNEEVMWNIYLKQ